VNKPAFQCVGFTPRETGLGENCGNCKNWNRKNGEQVCIVRELLDELYAEGTRFNAFDRMMRTNRGVRI